MDRELVLDAAERVIRRDGSGVSLETIAFEAGVTKPIVYARVGGRTDLANALAERLSDRLVAAARTAIDGRPYGREMLAARNVRTLKSRWTHPDLQTPQPPHHPRRRNRYRHAQARVDAAIPPIGSGAVGDEGLGDALDADGARGADGLREQRDA